MNLQDLLKNKFPEWLRPSVLKAPWPGVWGTCLVVIYYSAATLSQGSSTTRFFFLSVVTIMLYSVSTRRFYHEIAHSVENRIAGIRLKVMDHVRNIDLHSFEKMGSDTIRTALTFDAKSVSEISHLIASTVQVSITMGVSLGYVAFLSPAAFFLMLLVCAIVGVFYAHNQILIRELIHKVRKQEGELFESLGHLLDGFKELRMNHKKSDDFFDNSFRPQASRLHQLRRHASQRLIDNYTLTYGLWQCLLIITVLVLPWVGLFPGDVLLIFVGLILCMPISFLIGHIPRIILAAISIRRLYELESILYELDQEALDTVVKAGEIEFKELAYEDIMFCYEESGGRPFSIGPLSLSVKAGEIIFITGGNGSGKSTLLKLISGLYPPVSGRVLLNNKEIHIHSHRWLFSAVFTDVHLFDRLYGVGDIDEDKAKDLFARMRLEDKVGLVGGNQFSTLDLSTGQKKRLALIAAMLEDKPVCIFDEWAADQDPHFRRYFYETLLNEFKAKGKTVIAVTHDDRYFHVADRVMKIDYGQLV